MAPMQADYYIEQNLRAVIMVKYQRVFVANNLKFSMKWLVTSNVSLF